MTCHLCRGALAGEPAKARNEREITRGLRGQMKQMKREGGVCTEVVVVVRNGEKSPEWKRDKFFCLNSLSKGGRHAATISVGIFTASQWMAWLVAYTNEFGFAERERGKERGRRWKKVSLF